jgi:pterin-4a-carbinolamine dehydratase
MVINYDRVELRLASHDVEDADNGALTARDVALAHEVDAFAPERDSAA